MPTLIGVARESNPGEHRVALVPDVAKRFRALGADILIEQGAGENSAYPDADFADVRWTERPADIWTQADAILCVRPPTLEQVASMKPGGILITCSCSGKLRVDQFGKIVADAIADVGRPVQLLERRGAGRDHPPLINVPETEYLKCWILRVLP